MGALAMVIAAAGFWKFVSRRAALYFVGLLLLGFISYATRADASRQCDGRAWFCDIVELMPEQPAVAEGPPPCPETDPITTRIFSSAAADAEVHRLIAAGVCQREAIERVASGWNAEYDPQYGPWWRRLF